MSSRTLQAITCCAWLIGVTLAASSCSRDQSQGDSATSPAVAAKHIAWLDDLDAALKQAGQAKKPVMVDFSTTWCGWCKRLESQTLSDPRVAERAGRFVAVRIDGDKHRDLVKKYRIQGYPTILFLDATGREVHRVAGFRDAEPFLAEMEQALAASAKASG